MKWIRRKPSWPVRCGVVLVCLLFLFTRREWVGTRSPGFGWTESNWSEFFYFKRDETQPASALNGIEWVKLWYCVIERDDQIIIASRLDDGYFDMRADPESLHWEYKTGSYQSGSWAPTRWYETKRLVNPLVGNRAYGDRDAAPWTPRLQRMHAGLIAQRELDPRLNDLVSFSDGHIIWSGYVANSLSPLALLLLAWAFLWSLAWVPAAIRRRTRRGRLALGLCPMCTYDLSGTPDGCPECGWVRAEGASDADEASA